MGEEEITPAIRLARDYARLLSENSNDFLLNFVLSSPETQRILQEVYVHGKELPKPKNFQLIFNSEEYAKKVAVEYLFEKEELDAEDKDDLLEDYCEALEEKWNLLYFERTKPVLYNFVDTLKKLEPKHPLLGVCLFDINGEFRQLDYKRGLEFFEISRKERKSLIEKDGIDDAVFIQVSYLNLLAETIDEIDKRNQSGLVSILDQFRQKKQDQ